MAVNSLGFLLTYVSLVDQTECWRSQQPQKPQQVYTFLGEQAPRNAYSSLAKGSGRRQPSKTKNVQTITALLQPNTTEKNCGFAALPYQQRLNGEPYTSIFSEMRYHNPHPCAHTHTCIHSGLDMTSQSWDFHLHQMVTSTSLSP